MTPDERMDVLDLIRNRINDDDFLQNFKISRDETARLSINTLEQAYREQQADDVEYGLLIGFHFGFVPEHVDILCKLSDAEWHYRHEDVVMALDELRDRRAVDVLYRAALTRHPHLDYDDSRALAVKAIWALGRLADASADAKLRVLAEFGEPILTYEALKQLRRRGLEPDSSAQE